MVKIHKVLKTNNWWMIVDIVINSNVLNSKLYYSWYHIVATQEIISSVSDVFGTANVNIALEQKII